jgi:hypothetical protein
MNAKAKGTRNEHRLFAAPGNCRKLVHRWRERQCRPDVEELTAGDAR